MKVVECSRCGSKELLAADGYLQCLFCRSRFELPEQNTAKKDTAINVLGDIQKLLKKCEDDPVNRIRYASLVLDIDPTNEEASKYLY